MFTLSYIMRAITLLVDEALDIIVLFDKENDLNYVFEQNLSKNIMYMIYDLPAIISIMCLNWTYLKELRAKKDETQSRNRMLARLYE